MKIFDKRPLASILCMFLLGFVAFSQGEVWLKVCTVAILPLLLLFSIFKANARKLLLGLCSAVVLSMLFSFVYFDVFFYQADNYLGTNEITATVYEIDTTNGKIVFQAESIGDDTPFSNKMVMYTNGDDAEALKVGDIIKFRGKIVNLNEDIDGQTSKYYASLGISARCELTDTIEVISHGEPPLEYKIASFRERLTRRAMMLSDNYSGKLISALLFGEKSILSDKTTLDFRRIGLSHVLALSGMHLAILSLGITKLLGFFGIGKKTAGIFNIIFTVGYMFLTGFPISVVRAGIMLIIATLLFFLVGSRDSFTSLAISAFLICLFDPTSIFDISLWLSVFATLGIIIFSEYESSKVNRRKRQERDNRKKSVRAILGFLNYVKLSILTSVFAIGCTLLISMLEFEGISVASAISTLIITPFITVFMYLGALTLIIGDIIPIGALLSPISKIIEWLSSSISSFDDIYVSTSGTLPIILSIALTLVIIVFLIFKLTKRLKIITLFTIGFLLVSTYLSSFILNISKNNNNDILFQNDAKTSTFVFKSGGKSAVLFSATYNDYAFGYINNAIKGADVSELDYYMVTHYGYGLINHFKSLSSNYRIETLVLPRPRNEDEQAILARLEAALVEYGANIEFFESKTPFIVGDLDITLNHSTQYGQDTIRSAFTINDGETIYTYLSSGMLLEDYSNLAYKITLDTDVLIFGSHGKSYPQTHNIDETFLNVKTFILCSDNLYFTQDSLDIYKERGCEIYSHPYFISIKN